MPTNSIKTENRNTWRWVALIAIVGVIVAAFAFAVSSFINRPHGMTAKEACLYNLMLIDASKATWERENNKRAQERTEPTSNQPPAHKSHTIGATQSLLGMQDIVSAPIAAALPDNVKRVQLGMSLDRALDTLGLLHCRCRLSGHGYEANYGVDLMYSLPGDRWARVSFRLDRTRTISDPVPQRPGRGAVWDSLGNCPVKTCELTITPEEEPNTTSDGFRQPADGSSKP